MRSRSASRAAIPRRPFRIRPTVSSHPANAQGPQVMVVADEDVAKLWPSAPAFSGSTTSPTSTAPCRSRPSRWRGSTRMAPPQPPMMGCHQPSERFKGPSSRSPGSRRDCGSSISRIRSHRESRILRIGFAAGLQPRILQRRHHRRSGPVLFDRPPARRRCDRDLGTLISGIQ